MLPEKHRARELKPLYWYRLEGISFSGPPGLNDFLENMQNQSDR